MNTETTQKRPDTVEAVLKLNAATMPDYSHLSEAEAKHEKGQFVWKQIVKSLNTIRNPKWVADYNDPNQPKYWPYAYLKKDSSKRSGFGFSYTAYYCTDTDTFVGVRLLFASSDDVMYALEVFEQEYIESIIY